MSQNDTQCRVLVCVPFIRTFFILVRKQQQIKVIMRAFPNITDINALLFWHNGSQLSPNLTFAEAGIHGNCSIIVGIKTDDLMVNRYVVGISINAGKPDFFGKFFAGVHEFREKSVFKRNRDIYEEKKFRFIEKVKSMYGTIDFSKNKCQICTEQTENKLSCDPLPIMF